MPRHHEMILRQPATRWESALPVGNGSIGAMLYGRVARERVLVNHEALWRRRPRPRLANVSDCLGELRNLLAAGRYDAANDFLQNKLIERGTTTTRPDPYQPAFDIEMLYRPAGAFRHYRRGIDFGSALAWTRWHEPDRTLWRALFVSDVDDVIVMQFACEGPGGIDATVYLQQHDPTDARVLVHDERGYPEPVLTDCDISTARGGWIAVSGRLDTGDAFGGLVRVVARGGTMDTREKAVAVRGAEAILLLAKPFANRSPDSALADIRQELEVIEPDFDALLARHEPIHRELFERVSLELGEPSSDERTDDELLSEAYDNQPPAALLEHLFEFGRHLLICSSRRGDWPANLQGIWNGHYAPPWAADYHNDQNVQMMYWQALPGNLPETLIPYFDYYESLLDDFRTNARNLYGCRGILLPICQSTHGLPHPAVWVNWTAAAGWIAQMFFDYWLFTGDREFLASRAVPFLKEVAAFYEDFCTTGPDGKLMFSPSLSPENTPSRADCKSVTVNATMDIAVCREVLGNLCQACKLLDIEPEGIRRWRDMLDKLPTYEVNDDGAFREWLHPDLPDNYHHRHYSHLYPLFPGTEITPEGDLELFAACRVAVDRRRVVGIGAQCSWSLGHLVNLYARLGDGDTALDCMALLARSCVGDNLFVYLSDWRAQGLLGEWGRGSRGMPALDIDTNYGLTAGITEMLVYSTPGRIRLLPALPKQWATGSIRGVATRAGASVCVEWDMPAGKLHATVRAGRDAQVAMKLPLEPQQLDSNVKLEASELGATWRTLRLQGGETCELEASW